MRDFTDELKDLRRRLGDAEGYLKIDVGRSRLAELEMEVSRPDLWDDQEHELALGDVEVGVLQRRHLGGVGLGDIFEFDHGRFSARELSRPAARKWSNGSPLIRLPGVANGGSPP